MTKRPLLRPAGLLCLMILLCTCVRAQTTLTLDEALDWTLREHPLARAADAVEQRGAAAALELRALTDPKLKAEYDRKDFKGTEYYDYGKAELSWQSPFAFEILGGYQVAEGTFLNAERTLPDAGQAYLAIKVPLLRGLLLDEVRIGRRRAELQVERQRALGRVLRNELRYDLTVRYLDWAYANDLLALNQEVARFLNEQLENSRGLYRQGDKPAVDTLEYSVYLNDQLLTVQQSANDLLLAARALQELYWPLGPDDRPLPLATVSTPQGPLAPDFTTHPELLDLQLQLVDVSLQRDLKREALKPVLDAEYYLLGDGLDLPETERSALSANYKLGVTASYPLLNRKARAGLQLGELKVLETEAKLQAKDQALRTKVEAYTAALVNYRQQLAAAERLAVQSAQLLAAEQQLYDLGESTQFLLNTRAQALLKARMTVAKSRFGLATAATTRRYLLAAE